MAPVAPVRPTPVAPVVPVAPVAPVGPVAPTVLVDHPNTPAPFVCNTCPAVPPVIVILSTAPKLVAPETVNPVNVPTLVIAGWAAAVTVAALPLALPVNAPINVVDVTLVSPASVAPVAPKEMLVEPMVIELFVSAPFGIAVKFVPVSIGVFVQPGVVPDTRTWLDVPVGSRAVVFAAD